MIWQIMESPCGMVVSYAIVAIVGIWAGWALKKKAVDGNRK